MALSNDEASEGIWDVKGEVSAPGAAHGGFHGGGCLEISGSWGSSFGTFFPKTGVFTRGVSKKWKRPKKEAGGEEESSSQKGIEFFYSHGLQRRLPPRGRRIS